MRPKILDVGEHVMVKPEGAEGTQPTMSTRVTPGFYKAVKKLLNREDLFDTVAEYTSAALYAFTFGEEITTRISAEMRNELKSLQLELDSARSALKARTFDKMTAEIEALLLLMWRQEDFDALQQEYNSRLQRVAAISPRYERMYRVWLEGNPRLQEVRAYVKKTK